jgi:hypothetical protein
VRHWRALLMRHLAYQDEIILGMQDCIEDLYGEVRKK